MAAHARTLVLLAIVAIIAGWAGVTSLPALDRDESRFMQATTQMLETGDYVNISFQDQPRHKKPVGIHWFQAASVSLFSDADARAPWAYRLPSILGAVITTLATYWAGVVLIGRRAAGAAALLVAVTMLVGSEASIAKSDSMMVGMTTLAMAGLAALYAGAGRWAGLVFWGALAAGILIKGPVTPMVAGLTLVALVALDRRIDWLKGLVWWPGPLLALAIAAPWFVMIQLETDGAFIAKAVSSDLAPKGVGGHEGHGAPPGYHTLLLPFLFFPATLFLLPGLALAGRAVLEPYAPDARAGGLRFAFAWFLPAFLVFEIMPTKLFHYTLPVFPALAIMGGAAYAALAKRSMPMIAKAVSILLFATAGGVFAMVVALAPRLFPAEGPVPDIDETVRISQAFGSVSAPEWAALAAVVAALFVLPLVLWRAPKALMAAVVAVGIAMHWAVADRTLARMDAFAVSERVSLALEGLSLHPRTSAAARPPLAAAGYTEPSLVFYTDTETRLGTPEIAASVAALEAGRAAAVEIGEVPAFLARIEDLGARVVEVERVDGFNYSNGVPVTIVIFRTTLAGQGSEA